MELIRANSEENQPISLKGSLTIYEVAKQKLALLDLLKEESSLRLNLEELVEIDSAGIQLLILLLREAKLKGIDIQISDISESVENYLSLYTLHSFFGLALNSEA